MAALYFSPIISHVALSWAAFILIRLLGGALGVFTKLTEHGGLNLTRFTLHIAPPRL